jgi:hypothetical protein
MQPQGSRLGDLEGMKFLLIKHPESTMKNAVLYLLLFCSLAVNEQKFTIEERTLIVSKLEKAFDLDQRTRSEFEQCYSKNGSNDVVCEPYRKKIETQDSVNQQVVFGILDKYGWLQQKEISEKANKAFFYVIQHSSLAAQSKYAALIDTAYKQKEITSTEYAYFVDRLRIKQGKVQIYGTQSATDNLGNKYMYPIGDLHLADSLRKFIGAPPVAEFIRSNEFKFYNAPKTDFSKRAIIIGHIWDTHNKAVDNLQVFVGPKLIGQSDKNGFFILEIDKLKGKDITITLQKVDFKSINYPIKGGQDFYEVYAQIR